MSFAGIHFDAFHLVVIGLALIVATSFGVTRTILGWVFGLLWSVLKVAGKILWTLVHEGGSRILHAHVVWLKNWRPRIWVVSSVRPQRSTRRMT